MKTYFSLLRALSGAILESSLILSVVLGTGFAVAYAQYYPVPSTGLTSTIGIGSTGSDVSALQSFLATNPLIYPQGLVTGYYGTLTANAVRQFQTTYGIMQTGSVGPITMAKVNSLIASGLGLDTTVPVQYNILALPMTSSATVTWTTSEMTRGKVFYSSVPMTTFEAPANFTEPTTNGTMLTDGALAQNHSVVLSGLASHTTYYYVVESIDPSGNVSITNLLSFTTTQ